MSKVDAAAADGLCQHWLTNAGIERETDRSHHGSATLSRTSVPAVQRRRFASALIALGAALALAALASACRGGKPSLGVAGLAFTRTDGHHSSIWVAKTDGSDARQIAAHAFAGTLSPDGRRVAYSLPQDTPDSGLTPLYVVDVESGEPRRIDEASGYAWSRDGARLAVSDGKALVLLDVTSGRRRELVRSGDVVGLSFAPDGKALAYSRHNGRVGHEYRSDIFVIRLSDGEIEQLTHDGHSDRPVWGRGRLAYRHFRFDGDWSIGELRLMRPDGSGARLFARGNEDTSQAQMGLDPLEFSEDGKRLLACAVSEFYCPPVTFTVPGGAKRELSVGDQGIRVVQAWDLARDGTEVLVDAGAFDDDTHHRVYAIPFEGGKPRLLVRDATSPSWAH